MSKKRGCKLGYTKINDKCIKMQFSTKKGATYYIDENDEYLKYLLRKWPTSFDVIHIRSQSTGKLKTVSVDWIEKNIAAKEYDKIRYLHTR